MAKTNTVSKIAFQPVTGSSTIKAFAKDTSGLLLKFTSGETYKYTGVTEQVINEFAAAPSKGKYFGANIRNKYTAEKQ